MATKKKMLQAAAGSATGGAALDITDVFSTYLRSGTGAGTSFSVSNGIDLDGEGGLVWYKRRTGTAIDHVLVDSERGAGYVIESNTTDYSRNRGWFTSFNSDGFSGNGQGNTNDSGEDYASWSFRKASKFFTCVEYTGNSTEGRTVSHDLGSVPGVILVKCTSHSGDWSVYHRGLSSPATKRLQLNSTSAEVAGRWNSTLPTSTEFTLNDSLDVNGNGRTFVAYLFAHNDGDGGFGPDGDADIIKCGSYTGNGSTTGPEIDLGFEPQFVLVKRTDSSSGWFLMDTMRGMAVGNGTTGSTLYVNTNNSNAEDNFSSASVDPTSTGFNVDGTNTNVNASGGNYIYMAIRRGSLAQPKSATEVFALQQDDAGDGNAPAFRSDFPVDAAFSKNAAASSVNFFGSRLQGANYLRTSETNAEAANADFQWDYMNGWNSEPAQGSSVISYMWKRAPGYFDAVAYTGNSTAGRTVSHNLGVAPEMMWVKKRNNVRDWKVYHSAVGNGIALELNATGTGADSPAFWNDTTPTESVISLGTSDTVNGSNDTYIAYLFATLPGVSKVGSYTGNGSSQTIDCGFTSGARFVLIKNTEQGRGWVTIDTTRGLTSGDDKVLYLNATNAQSDLDFIDPNSSGFTLSTSNDQVNASGRNYIFYAIA